MYDPRSVSCEGEEDSVRLVKVLQLEHLVMAINKLINQNVIK